MKKKLRFVSSILVIFLFTSFFYNNETTVGIISNSNCDTSDFDFKDIINLSIINEKQDGRFIEKLEWLSPNSELPGTYKEYLKNHPLEPAIFSDQIEYYESFQPNGEKISILVDTFLHLMISSNLNQYIDDLNAEGYSVYVKTVTGGSPNEIKSWIIDSFNKGSIGFVFVGDITAAWAEVSGSVFPCDLYYMDLDGNWEDNDYDGVYEIHTSGYGDMGPEVYVGRICANTLNYNSETNMVNNYLNKIHNYRVGKLKQTWQSLAYIDEDWYDMDVFLRYIYGENVYRYDSGFETTGEDYLDKMDDGHHFVQVCAHSYSGGHHFGTRPTESASYTHVYVFCPSLRSAKLLLGCDDGIKVWLNFENVYTNDRYGGWVQDAYEVDVTLNQGWNQLLCKISQAGGDYMLSACFTDANYNIFNDLIYQINNPELFFSEGEFIRGWLLNGFHQDISDNFWYYLTTNYLGVDESSINPLDGEVMGGKTWTYYNTGNPYVNMGEYCNDADFGVCYAFVRVYSEETTSCQLWLGYGDGARVWLNSEEVLYDNLYGDFEADMSKINITLQTGENRLLVKISEWMGDHGFSARFCNSNGSIVEGIYYDPIPQPISHIGSWLVNGPYYNQDVLTRLTMDYLGDEKNATPSENDPAPVGIWKRVLGEGCPLNIGSIFDHGDWVFSEDIQNHDPPVLFYNLFACGPGRFTDENYLAGAYIFNTSYGLISIASSKSGSMLNFNHFTNPLNKHESIGKAFQDWFEAQAPFVQWEKEWYYGMMICGDPLLFIINNEHPNSPNIKGPSNGKPRIKHEYILNATDPERDNIYFYVDWADKSNSGWLGPYESGEEVEVSHTWLIKGTYNIKVRVKDEKNLLSPWTTFEITMPKIYINNETLLNFLQHHPIIYSLFRYIFNL